MATIIMIMISVVQPCKKGGHCPTSWHGSLATVRPRPPPPLCIPLQMVETDILLSPCGGTSMTGLFLQVSLGGARAGLVGERFLLSGAHAWRGGGTEKRGCRGCAGAGRDEAAALARAVEGAGGGVKAGLTTV